MGWRGISPETYRNRQPDGAAQNAMRSETMSNTSPPDTSGEPLPCPFCGGKAEIDSAQYNEESLASIYVVYCAECDLSLAHNKYSKQAAIAAWNTRTTERKEAPDEAECVCGARSPAFCTFNTMPHDCIYKLRITCGEACARAYNKAMRNHEDIWDAVACAALNTIRPPPRAR